MRQLASSLQFYRANGKESVLLINDVRRQNYSIRKDIEHAVSRVLEAGWYILGPEVEQFEAEFASYCRVAECVTTANGTDALELALRALGIGPGDRVATVANAGMYATTAILAAGGQPVYVDVDPVSMLITVDTLRTAGNVKAAVVTHLYGQMADMPLLLSCGIPIIEDCAQAHGAVLNGRRAGSWGFAGCFSFYPTKNLGALGDGGAVVTNSPETARHLRALRQYGWRSKYISVLAGGRNSRMDAIQAAILRAKLPYLDCWNERRRELARRYDSAFGVPRVMDTSFVAHLYIIRSTRREEIQIHLKARDIATDVHYPIPDHRQPSISAPVSLPVTDQLCAEVLTLPLFPEMTDTEVDRVIEAVIETGGAARESL
jgi:dTDP-3-amino-2,3,6-trideoxy-4-keto-D-glucose/dTDP-3-amino-3,4,6-trideoxy-alpha-D-glucose/dTDP-2,6-dideoxy-D-kanosamine transaminase